MVLKVFKNESLEMIELETFFLFLSWHLDVWKSNDSKSFIQNQKFQKIFFQNDRNREMESFEKSTSNNEVC